MSRPEVGGPLYRELLMLVPAFQYSAFSISLVWLFGFIFWGTIVGYIIAAIAIASTIAAILFVPPPSAIYQKGAALPVSLWGRLANGRRRWVLQGEVLGVWPLVNVSPIGGKRALVAYEIRSINGNGCAYVARGGSRLGLTFERRNQLTSAIRAMLGPKWSSVYRQIPSVDQDLIDRMNALLSKPAMRIFRRGVVWLQVMAFSVIAFSVMLVLFGLEMFGYVLCDAIIILLVTLAILGIYRWIADVRMASKRFEAFSLYVQLKDYERTTGNRTIRGIAVHQEYGSTEPIIMGETIDGPKLLREIKRQFIGITLYIAGTLPPVFVFGLVVMTGSNFLLALVAFALSGLALLPLDILGLRMTLAGADAASRLEAIIREEWRTGTPLLPVDFKLPEGHGVFRTPPIPTKAQLGMMRRSRDFRIERVVSAGIAAIAISMISVMLDIGGDLGVIAILAPMLAFMGYFVFRASGLILLDKLREYEEVSGKIVLPPDLSLARMIP